MTADAANPLAPFHAPWPWLGLVAAGVLAVLALWGHAFLHLLPGLRAAQARPAHGAESLLYGVLGFSLLGLAGVWAGWTVLQTFAAGSAAAVASLAWRRPRPAVQATNARPVVWLAPLVIVVGALLWSASTLRGLELQRDGTLLFVPWVDFFFHARQISGFARFDGDHGALHGWLHGAPLAPYHYASYLVGALVVRLSGVPALQVATSLYPILGLALCGAAMLVLAQASAGRVAALLGVALLFGVPDPSGVVPGLTRIGSWHFFQQVGVGGAYATAVLGLALACAWRAGQSGSLGASAWACGLLLASALFKVQLLLAYGVLVFVVILALAPRLDNRVKLLLAAASVALAWLAVQRMGAVPNAPTMNLSLANLSAITHLPRAFAWLLLPPVAVGVWLLSYGVLLPLAALLAWRARHDRALRPTLVLLGATLAAHAAVRLLIGDNRGFGDAFEINRKTLVLPYFIVVYAIARLLAAEFARAPERWQRHRRALGGLAGALLALSIVAALRLQHWPGTSEPYSRVAVERGLLGAAAFLRDHTAAQAVVQTCTNDRLNMLATLAERPTHVSKLMVNPNPLQPLERERLERLRQLDAAGDAAAARALARTAGIDWLVVHGACRAPWSDGVPAAWSGDGWRVFDLRGAAGAPG